MLDTSNPFASPLAEVTVAERGVMGEHPEALCKVRTGLSLVYYGICGILLSVLLLVIVSVLRVPGGMAGMGPMQIAMVLFAIAIMLFMLMMLIGEAFCIAVPAESGAKGLAVAAFLLAILPFLSGIAGVVIGRSGNPALGQMISNIGSLVQPLSLLCFVLFLRQTAIFIGRRDVAGRAVRTLAVGVLATLLTIGGAVFVGMSLVQGGAAVDPPPAAFMVMGLGSLMMLVALLMYANTITYLRKAITV